VPCVRSAPAAARHRPLRPIEGGFRHRRLRATDRRVSELPRLYRPRGRRALAKSRRHPVPASSCSRPSSSRPGGGRNGPAGFILRSRCPGGDQGWNGSSLLGEKTIVPPAASPDLGESSEDGSFTPAGLSSIKLIMHRLARSCASVPLTLRLSPTRFLTSQARITGWVLPCVARMALNVGGQRESARAVGALRMSAC
jgi:hypothetical protein